MVNALKTKLNKTKQNKTYYYIIEIWNQTLISELDLRRMSQKFWDFEEEKIEKNWKLFQIEPLHLTEGVQTLKFDYFRTLQVNFIL